MGWDGGWSSRQQLCLSCLLQGCARHAAARIAQQPSTAEPHYCPKPQRPSPRTACPPAHMHAHLQAASSGPRPRCAFAPAAASLSRRWPPQSQRGPPLDRLPLVHHCQCWACCCSHCRCSCRCQRSAHCCCSPALAHGRPAQPPAVHSAGEQGRLTHPEARVNMAASRAQGMPRRQAHDGGGL